MKPTRRTAASAIASWRLTGAALVLSLLAACAGGPGTGGSGGVGAEPRTASDQTDADRRAGVRLELASGYFARGQYSTALDEIKQALQVKPDFREALNLRGLVYAALGETALAEESFRRTLGLYPRDGDTLHNYGWFLCQQRRWNEAFAQFELALAQPQYRAPSRTWLAKGACEAQAGRAAEAERSLSRAFELDPANPAIAFNLAEVLMRAGQLERARFYIGRVNAQADQNTAESLWLALRIERRLGNRAGAEDLGRQLRQRYPQSEQASALERGQFDD